MSIFKRDALEEFEFTMPDVDAEGLVKFHEADQWWTHPEVLRRSGYDPETDDNTDWKATSRLVSPLAIAQFINPHGVRYNPSRVRPDARKEAEEELQSLVSGLYIVGSGGLERLAGTNVQHWSASSLKDEVRQALQRAGGTQELPVYKRVLVRLFDCQDRYRSALGACSDETLPNYCDFAPSPQNEGYIRTLDPYWEALISSIGGQGSTLQQPTVNASLISSYLEEGGENFDPSALGDHQVMERKTILLHEVLVELASLGLRWSTAHVGRAVGDDYDRYYWAVRSGILGTTTGVGTLEELKLIVKRLQQKHGEWEGHLATATGLITPCP